MKNIFFVGINGIGMSGLAIIMKKLGYNVAGSDISKSYLSEKMEKNGIKIYNYHDGKNILGMDTLVVSTAISKENPEYKKAIENNILVLKRGELLAKLFNEKIGIGVAGTHGKTTTSSMMAKLLLEKDPTIVVGGIIPGLEANSKYGDGKYFVAEADESDNSFLYMNPKYSIITNIEADHLEKHGSLENIKKSFRKFIEQTEEKVIVCEDCENLKEIVSNEEKIVKYSLENRDSNIFADNFVVDGRETSYDVYINQKFIGKFSLVIPGKHNIYNSLPVIYLALEFGIECEKIKDILKTFSGAKRRYEILYEKNDIKVIDDYAHHPTEIKATLDGARSIENGNIVAIFQPHRFSRVKFLLDEFNGAFEKADELILMPIYSAGEEDEFGISLEVLKEKINHKNSKIIENDKLLEKNILEREDKNIYVFMGAGSISSVAHDICKNLD